MMWFYKIKQVLVCKAYKELSAYAMKEEDKQMQELVSELHLEGKGAWIDKTATFRGTQYIEMGCNCALGQNSWIDCLDNYFGTSYSPKLTIGDNFNMQRNCHIGCIERVKIGNNVLLGSKVYISDHLHGEVSKEALALPPIERPLWSRPVKIGDNCMIGDNVTILPGVTLGKNVIVGANAVVTHDFDDNSVIAGCPARLLRKLE